MRRTGPILVVENHQASAGPFEHLLRRRQFDTVVAGSAEAALAALRIHAPAAAIIDLDVEGGKSRDVIVRMPPKAPVIMVSGTRAASGELERLRPRTRLVEKPCSLTWVIDALEDMLASAQQPLST